MKLILNIVFLFFISIAANAAIDIEVQGLFSGKAVVLINGQRHILSVGKTSPEGVKMIAADSRGAVLEVKGQKKSYLLGHRVSTTFAKKEKKRVQIVANDRGMFLSHGSINGQSVHFLVDTGATTVALSEHQAKRLGILYRMNGIESQASTASGLAKAWKINLKSVSLGSIKQKNVKAVVVEGDYPRRVLLGMSFLDKLHVKTVANKMMLEQRF